jgi:hypothetical protein
MWATMSGKLYKKFQVIDFIEFVFPPQNQASLPATPILATAITGT